MKKTIIFDVLVVYSATTAASANKLSNSNTQPFAPLVGRSNYNKAYAHFLQTCNKLGLTAALSTSSDIVGPGRCSSYWLFDNGDWKKVNRSCYSSHIFDKFSSKNKALKTARQLCFSSDEVRPFNSDHLEKLFTDKLRTYQELSTYAIPTVALNTDSPESIRQSIKNLQHCIANHTNKKDFSSIIIMKDRFGSEGNAIFKITNNFSKKIISLAQEYKNISFILQPFVKFDTGYSYKQYSSATDIRLIYQNGKIIQTYIRMAKKNDFRCNQHQGGTLIYTNKSEIPLKVRRVAQKIAQQLNEHNSLFALDFIVSNAGTVYFLEGNNGPGIIWDLGFKKDEEMAKQLIKGIVKEFVERVAQMQLTPIKIIGNDTLPFGRLKAIKTASTLV